MEAHAITGHAVPWKPGRRGTASGWSDPGRAGACTEACHACAANLGSDWRYRERGGDDGERKPAWHLLARFRIRRQPEIDAAIVVLLSGGRQVEVGKRDLVM